MTEMTVSQLARRVGASADTVRYYERIGLMPEAERSPSGYRLFGEDDLERLAFIRRAQSIGLQLDDIRELLAVRDRGLCPCGHARERLRAKLTEVEERMAELAALRDVIQEFLDNPGATGSDGCWPCGDALVTIQPRDRSTQ